MTKSSQIKKLVNGEIADADDVNQIVENAGTEGGAIPYEPTGHEQDEVGSQSLGSTAYPWGSLKINKDAELVEVDKDSHTVSDSVAIKNLRKFITLKDTPSAYTGYGGLPVLVKGDESGLEFKTYQASQLFTASGSFTVPTGVSVVFVSMTAGGGSGARPSGSEGGGGGAGAYCIRVAVKVTAGNSYNVTVGAGGAAPSAGGNGNAGGNSSFVGDDITLTCNGGAGATSTTHGAGGAASGANNASGTTPGGQATSAGGDGSDGAGGYSGSGGGNPFGRGGAGNQNANGNDGTGYGSGGGGAENAGTTTTYTGGAGKAGLVYIEW